MSKIEFDMRISGDVEETIDDQNITDFVTNFKMHNFNFSKQNNEIMDGEEATDAIVSMINGIITTIAPSLTKDEADVDKVVEIIVGKLALAVGVDPQELMLASLRMKIGRNK